MDSRLRRLFQSPDRILYGHVKEGMKVLDFGCGPGFFTEEIAKRVGETGSVIAVDLQQGMLDILRRKMHGSGFEARVKLHKCTEDRLGLSDEVDLVFAFYVMHELRDATAFLKEFRSMLGTNGRLYIAEPRAHVAKRGFDRTISSAEEVGFSLIERRARLLTKIAVLGTKEPDSA